MRLTEVRQVLVPRIVDAVNLEDPAQLTQALDGDARREDDDVEDERDCEEVCREDERVRELGSDEAQTDGEHERDRLQENDGVRV